MADYPVFSIWTDAYLADTYMLDNGEHGAYLLLLFAAWRSSDCCLPDNDETLRMIARCNPAEWSRIRDKVLSFFDVNSSGKLTQKRLTKERKRIERFKENRKRAGKKGAAARWHPDNNQDDNSIAMTEPSDSQWQNIATRTRTNTNTQVGNSESNTSDKDLREGINEVLAYWKQAIGKPNWSNTPSRKDKIKTVLTTWKLTVEQCKETINGALLDPTLNHENEKGPFFDIEHIFRNESRAERLRDRSVNDKGNDTESHTHTRKTKKQGTLDITAEGVAGFLSDKNE